ncbi:polyprenol monophosphomannose synthase [Bdellovibrio sp. HCB337]|uniref:polyprenol monophosphomannose synthase n=1 Tax=Bdellovibrio sp. HCB337 TaxID=3394358 RepID=UPI0039A688E2
MKALIIIPTYNEKENIQNIVQAVFAQNLGVDILVVDDNSPDGTGQIVQEMQKSQPKLHLLSRPGKQGLGRAYIAGFNWGMEHGFDVLTEMDADFSHRPEDLGPLLGKLKTHDFAVGSRYVEGGRTVNWGLMRKIISRGGGIYSRLILGFPLNDWTGGFNSWKKEVLLGIDLSTVTSNGYSFQIELKYKALKKGFKGAESPIVFEDRRVGHSKMSLKIVIEAFYRVWLMRFK